jgi:hypothetical protein
VDLVFVHNAGLSHEHEGSAAIVANRQAAETGRIAVHCAGEVIANEEKCLQSQCDDQCGRGKRKGEAE